MARPKSSDSGSKTPGVKASRIRKSGTIEDVRRSHWFAVVMAERALRSPGASLQEQLSAIHALNQSAGAYCKTLEAASLAKEVAELRDQLAELRIAEGLRKVA